MVPQGSILGLVLFHCAISLVKGKFLWFEKAPDPNDRCTTTRIACPEDRWDDIHPPSDCMKGGLIWYYTTGRIHAHFYLDNTYTREFKLCLNAGEANALYIWYDFKGKYWTPMSFPNYEIGTDFKERCKYSHDGKLDLFFESPWYKLHFVSHVTWEIEELPPGFVPDDDEEELKGEDPPL